MNTMKLLLYGVSHMTVSEEDAKKYRLSSDEAIEKATEIRQLEGVEEVLILSNEMRTEFYLHVDESRFSHGDLLRYISFYSEESLEQVILETYSKFNGDVVRHLLNILAGRESSIEKEVNMLNEADEAVTTGYKIGTTGEALGRIFEEAIAFSLRLRTFSEMRTTYPSLFCSTLRLLKKEWQSLEHRRFYLTGESESAIFMAKALFYLDASTVVIGKKTDDLSLAAKLNEWAEKHMSRKRKRVFHSFTEQSMAFQLSSADAILTEGEEEAETAGLSDIQLNKMLTLRMTKKKQLLVSYFTSKLEKDALFKSRGIQPITRDDLIDQANEQFKTEDPEKVDALFEEQLESETEKLFQFYTKKFQIVTTGQQQSKKRTHFSILETIE